MLIWALEIEILLYAHKKLKKWAYGSRKSTICPFLA